MVDRIKYKYLNGKKITLKTSKINNLIQFFLNRNYNRHIFIDK